MLVDVAAGHGLVVLRALLPNTLAAASSRDDRLVPADFINKSKKRPSEDMIEMVRACEHAGATNETS